MKVKIKLPLLGENVREATMVVWLKALGESVVQGEALVEVMTDKTNVEIPSPATGVLIEQTAMPDEVLEPGAILGTIEI